MASMSQNEYIQYADLKPLIGLQAGDTDDDDLIRGICTRASRMLDGACFRRFYPRVETRYFDHPRYDVTVLKLDDDLLEVTTFTTNNTGTSISASDYFLMCGGVYGVLPYDRIALKRDGSQPNLLYSGTVQQANAVTGIWGYHEHWNTYAWEDTQDEVEDNPLTSTATLVTVNDADGADLYGFKPRFKEQMLVRAGTEYMHVTAVNATGNQLTVVRGANGSTAAEHVQNTTLYVYRPMPEIQEAAFLLAKWLYDRKDASIADQMGSVRVGGVVTVPRSAPMEVKEVIARYKRREYGYG
jgi:hypothetical protein